MAKQSEYDITKDYIVTLKFKFSGRDMDHVVKKIESREDIKLTNLQKWFKELSYEQKDKV